MPDQPIILPPGEGPHYWLLASLACPKLTADQTAGRYDLTEILALPDAGPPPHRHAQQDEMFFILEGQFGLIFDDQSQIAKAGDAVYLPKNIPHTYKNIGAKPGRFLTFAIPSGFADFVKEAGLPATDFINAPPLTEADFARVGASVSKFGIEILKDHRPTRQAPPLPAPRHYWLFGQQLALHLEGSQTAGNFCVITLTMPPSGDIPAHQNLRDTEMFYVLDGAVIFVLDDLQITAVAGTFLLVPPGVKHSLHNPGRAPARVLDIHTPSGFESFIREAATPCPDPAAPPPPFDAKTLPALMAKHGMT